MRLWRREGLQGGTRGRARRTSAIFVGGRACSLLSSSLSESPASLRSGGGIEKSKNASQSYAETVIAAQMLRADPPLVELASFEHSEDAREDVDLELAEVVLWKREVRVRRSASPEN